MNVLGTAFVSCLLSASISCKKDCATSEPTPTCDEKGNWQGLYTTPNERNFQVSENSFIANGVAQLVNSPWNYFYTSAIFSVPACREISTDDARLEVRLKNPL